MGVQLLDAAHFSDEIASGLALAVTPSALGCPGSTVPARDSLSLGLDGLPSIVPAATVETLLANLPCEGVFDCEKSGWLSFATINAIRKVMHDTVVELMVANGAQSLSVVPAKRRNRTSMLSAHGLSVQGLGQRKRKSQGAVSVVGPNVEGGTDV